MFSRTTGMRAARKIVTAKTWQIVVLVNPVQVAGESSGIESYTGIGDPSKDAISRITCKV